MLYTRSTKTRVTSLHATSFKTKHFIANEKTKAFTIKTIFSDGKERSITFYGQEVEQLFQQLSKGIPQ